MRLAWTEAMMRVFSLKLCLFLFLIVCLSGRTSELGVVVGATAGTVLVWPLYARLVMSQKQPGTLTLIEDAAEQDPNRTAAGEERLKAAR